MNNIKVITKFDFRTLKYVNLYLLKYKRKSYYVSFVFAAVTFVIAIYTIVQAATTQQEGANTNYFFGAVFIALGLLMVYQALNVEKKLDQNLVRFFYNKTINSQEISFVDDKILIHKEKDPENPVEYDWALISEIHEMPQFFLLFTGKQAAPVIVDRSDEALQEGAKDELDALIHEKASLKPYKKVDKDICKIPITYIHQFFEESQVIEEDYQELKEIESIEVESKEQVEEIEAKDAITEEESEEKSNKE